MSYLAASVRRDPSVLALVPGRGLFAFFTVVRSSGPRLRLCPPGPPPSLLLCDSCSLPLRIYGLGSSRNRAKRKGRARQEAHVVQGVDVSNTRVFSYEFYRVYRWLKLSVSMEWLLYVLQSSL